MGNSFDRTKAIKLIISQAKTLERNITRSLNDEGTPPHSRYVSFRNYAEMYNSLAQEAESVLELPKDTFPRFLTDQMKGHMDTLWGTQKQIMEMVALQGGMLLTHLESATDYMENEFENFANFIRSKLRASIFTTPTKEVEIQNTIEALLIGRNMTKGIDYDRETGKIEFSGKEYIPDFVLPKMSLSVEVKLVRPGKKSSIIDEINADITAYSTKYERMLFVVYDLGVIRDEAEFRRDIENAGANIKVVIVKQ